MNQIFAPNHLDKPPARIGDPRFDPVAAARHVSAGARERAPALDDDTSFPSEDVHALAESGLLVAALPIDFGGVGLGCDPERNIDLAHALMLIGSGSLPLGRLYEGHVNAVKLIAAYARPRQIARVADLVHRGELLGVWNTEVKDGIRLTRAGRSRHLEGRKVFCSGAGHIGYPIITARDEAGDLLMVMPTIDDMARADLSVWAPHGMRASASGAVDFSDLTIDDEQIIGGHDDFHRQPMFSTGAWRFAAVQTGGIAAVFDAARAHLVAAGRQNASQQRARMATAATAVQTARQWVFEAARLADDVTVEASARVAHVFLARTAIERAGLEVIELAQRSVGLAGFQRSHPLERLTRDLATYLRQPDPDGAIDDAAAFVLASDLPVLDLWPCR